MKILALESSATACSVALCEEDAQAGAYAGQLRFYPG